MTPPPLDVSADPDIDLDDTDVFEDEALSRVVERPDGYHWIAPDGRQEFGPYEHLQDALAAMSDFDDEMPPEEGDLAETALTLGIADWLDPETGAPAEDTVTRIEDA